MPQPPYSYKNSVKSDLSDELINVYLQRPLAGILTRAVYSTPITPNQLTVAAVLFGVAGGIALALHDAHLTTAAICFYLKDIFDSADGQLARAKKLFSRRGRFLDSVGDYVADLSLFGGIFIFLLRRGWQFPDAALISLIGFLGIGLRVSYHVFYQTAYLHQQKLYETNRLTEELRDEDYEQDATTIYLQKIFYSLYGWQDGLIGRLDAWCWNKVTKKDGSAAAAWYQDSTGLKLGGFLGFGTEFVLLTVCLLVNNVQLYLFVTIVGLNCVWLVTVLYRRIFLAGRILSEEIKSK